MVQNPAFQYHPVLWLFSATVPSECHIQNIFSLSNYPLKCEAHCSEAPGEILVNTLAAVFKFILIFDREKSVKRNTVSLHMLMVTLHLKQEASFVIPVNTKIPQKFWWPVDECEESWVPWGLRCFFLPQPDPLVMYSICTHCR